MGRRKMSDERRAARARARENSERLRELAEKAFAELPERERAERERAGSNGEWLRFLAEKAQAELDRREQRRESA
jgi:hypothetical protein